MSHALQRKNGANALRSCVPQINGQCQGNSYLYQLKFKWAVVNTAVQRRLGTDDVVFCLMHSYMSRYAVVCKTNYGLRVMQECIAAFFKIFINDTAFRKTTFFTQ